MDREIRSATINCKVEENFHPETVDFRNLDNLDSRYNDRNDHRKWENGRRKTLYVTNAIYLTNIFESYYMVEPKYL